MSNSNYNDALHQIINVFQKHVELSNIDIHKSFASLGVTSLRAAQLILDINFSLNVNLKVYDLFLYPTPHALANYLSKSSTDSEILYTTHVSSQKDNFFHDPIAIIAMDCKYPGADDCEVFWKNCISNKENITFFNKNESIKSEQSDFSYNVYARGILNNIEYFDAQFFNYSPKEAHLSDPQHRLFIEAAWSALEKAGYASGDKAQGKVGVYASMNDSTYILDQYALQVAQPNLTDRFALQRLMSSQFLATKVAYLLNCSGPSISVQTACSSSLVAVVLACQQLASFECDMAIAGGVSIVTPQDRPYVYQQGNIYSPDGHCRPFDASAQGTVFSNGLGVVVLKRLSEAIRDRDFIVSVIKGYSLNNDGSHKMSYAAPSMQGQLDCILSAQAIAKVKANSIEYVEAHGTGTLIGDPIEIDALTKAFRQSTSKEQFCAIGSVKANIGHTHVAAGVAGLIKASLALQHQQIPPALHFTTPNPDIDFKRSPFYVNTRLLHWRKTLSPRRAAVSAFGVGGTNAHVILEEAPKIKSHPPKRKFYSVLLSAKSEKALQDYQSKLVDFLENQNLEPHASVQLANLAYTLQVGRNHYPYRAGIICENLPDALTQLKAQQCQFGQKPLNTTSHKKRIVFLFPGQGIQYVNMSRGLYDSELVYQKELDKCLTIASQYLDVELRDMLFPTEDNIAFAQSKILQTQFTHPILFSTEYSLAKLLEYWGIRPDVMLGHSLGEYVAACLAGVFSLEDAIRIVCARGDAISLCGEGAMMSVPLSKNEIQSFCTEDVGIAVETSPNLCVLSGSISGIETVKKRIDKNFPQKSLSIKKLDNSNPFHTNLLTDAVEPFLKTLQSITRNAPKISYLSNLTGDWVTETDVLNDQYWTDHMLKTVQLSQAIEKLLDNPDTVFVEVGPGRTLLSSLQMHTKDVLRTINILSSMVRANKYDDNKIIANSVKELWRYGCTVNWNQLYAHEKRNRIVLPTYPFQKQRFWIDQAYPYKQQIPNQDEIKSDLAFYTPSWVCDPKAAMNLPFPLLPSQVRRRWIVFANQSELCEKVCRVLSSGGEQVVKVFQEKDKSVCNATDYVIHSREKSQYDAIFEKIIFDDITHYAVIHFWGVGDSLELDKADLLDAEALYQSLYSGIFIAQALSQRALNVTVSWAMVTTQVHSVLGDEHIDPLKSGVLSLCRVLPLENLKFRMLHIDVDATMVPDTLTRYCNDIITLVADNLFNFETDNETQIIAFRNGKHWIPSYCEIKVAKQSALQDLPFVPGVYLITGGLGGMGLTLTQWICAKNASSTIVLLSRSEFPKQDAWDDWILNHPTENDISKKIRILRQVIDTGCHVKILQADIANFQKMKKIVSLIEARFGMVRGIFHLAGVSGKGLVALKKMDDVKKVLHPKIQGTHVLVKLFCQKKLDFFVCASSLTAIAGGVGQIDYCAANIFLDYFLGQRPLKHCKRFLTINWNAWRSVGMAANVGQATHCRLYAENSVTPKQGVSILNQLLSSPYSQIIVSRYSPENEIKRIKKTFQYSQDQVDQPSEKKRRCDLRDIVKQAWEKVLGVTEVNESTSFYGCGGDSLSLIQLIAIIEKHIEVKINLHDLVQYSVFNAMVDFIKNLMNAKVPFKKIID